VLTRKLAHMCGDNFICEIKLHEKVKNAYNVYFFLTRNSLRMLATIIETPL
jgi:hypothetical protein